VKIEFQKLSVIVYAGTALFENCKVEKVKNLDTLVEFSPTQKKLEN
jgi:hypothetical protein